MKNIVIASENPVKVAVAKAAFARVFPDEGFMFVPVKSVSGVPDQPVNEETTKGALNRLAYVQQLHPQADYWMSQEGGIHTEGHRYYCRAVIAVSDSSCYTAVAETAKFYLPTGIVELIMRDDMELGQAIDTFFAQKNTKHGIGAVGYMTDGLITREAYYEQAAIIALSELKHKDWYKAEFNT